MDTLKTLLGSLSAFAESYSTEMPNHVVETKITSNKGIKTTFLRFIDFLTMLYGRLPILSGSSPAFFWGVPSYSKDNVPHLWWLHSTVSCHCMQITISKQSENQSNQYPACNYWTYNSFLRSQSFPNGRCRALLECRKVPSLKSCVMFARPLVLPRGYVGIEWRWSHEKDSTFHIIRGGGGSFSSQDQIRMELIRRIGGCAFVQMVQRRFVAAWYHSGYLDKCPRLTPNNRCWHTGTRAGTIITGTMWYLLMSPGSASTTLVVLFLKCNNPITDIKPVMKVPVLVPVCQQAVAVTMTRISLGQFSGITRRYPGVTWHLWPSGQ